MHAWCNTVQYIMKNIAYLDQLPDSEMPQSKIDESMSIANFQIEIYIEVKKGEQNTLTTKKLRRYLIIGHLQRIGHKSRRVKNNVEEDISGV